MWRWRDKTVFVRGNLPVCLMNAELKQSFNSQLFSLPIGSSDSYRDYYKCPDWEIFYNFKPD